MARPGRVELPTLCLEGRRSIQLSYGRVARPSLSHLIQLHKLFSHAGRLVFDANSNYH
jgi:hypothetical protein